MALSKALRCFSGMSVCQLVALLVAFVPAQGLTTCRVSSVELKTEISGSSEMFRIEEIIDTELRKIKEGATPHGGKLSRSLAAGATNVQVCIDTPSGCNVVPSKIDDGDGSDADVGTLEWSHADVERGVTNVKFVVSYEVPLFHIQAISILAIELRRAVYPFNFLVGGCSAQETTTANTELVFADWHPDHHKRMCGDRTTAIYSRTGHAVSHRYCRICSKKQKSDTDVNCQEFEKSTDKSLLPVDKTIFPHSATDAGELSFSFGRILYNSTMISPENLKRCNAILYDQDMSSWWPVGAFGDIIFPFKAALMIIITTILFVAIYVRCPANCVGPQKIAVALVMITDLVTVWGLSVFPMCAAASFFSLSGAIYMVLLLLVFLVMMKGWMWLDERRRRIVYLPNVFKTYLVLTKDFPYWFTGIMLLFMSVSWLHFVTVLEIVPRSQMAALIACYLSINACLAVLALIKDLKLRTRRKTALLRLAVLTLLGTVSVATGRWLLGWGQPWPTFAVAAAVYIGSVLLFRWAKPLVVEHLDKANEAALKQSFRQGVSAKYGF